MERDNKLKLYFNKEKNDIEGMLPLSETEGRWDIYLLFFHFLSLKPVNDTEGLTLVQELEKRGYDLRTINFSIEKAQGQIEPIANRLSSGHISDNFKDFLFKFYIEGYILDRETFVKTNGEEIVFNNRSERRNYKLIFKAPRKYYMFSIEGEIKNVAFGNEKLNLFNIFLLYLRKFEKDGFPDEIINFCKSEDELDDFYSCLN